MLPPSLKLPIGNLTLPLSPRHTYLKYATALSQAPVRGSKPVTASSTQQSSSRSGLQPCHCHLNTHHSNMLPPSLKLPFGALSVSLSPQTQIHCHPLSSSRLGPLSLPLPPQHNTLKYAISLSQAPIQGSTPALASIQHT